MTWRTRKPALILIAVVLGLAGGCQPPAPQGAARDISQAQQRLLEELSQQVRADPANVDVRLRYAQALCQASCFEASLAELERILQACPDDSRARLARCGVLVEAGRNKDAQAELTQLLRSEPGNHPARLLLGYCYLDQQLYDDAEAALTSVASGQASVRQRVSAYLGLAFLYGKTGRNDSASRCYQQAMDLDDGVAEVLMQVERRGFVPSPVADPHGRIRSRRRISQGELERIIRDSRRQGQP